MTPGNQMAPIIIGGNGHSGTRLFAEILMACGIFMGIPGISYDRKSKDLNIRGLMNTWIQAYMLGLDEAELRKMERAFRRRIQLLIPLRNRKWGFKNPRAMFLLPFYLRLFPDMKFIHVIRDGKDMCFGNPFIDSPTYWGILTEAEVQDLSKEERMMKFWGEGNRRVRQFAEKNLGDRYVLIRFEDICDSPHSEIPKIAALAGASVDIDRLVALVRKPKSIGRWREFGRAEVESVIEVGRSYLEEFGYIDDAGPAGPTESTSA